MPLRIDLEAIRHNATVVRQTALNFGLDVTAVIKEPFAMPGVVDAVLSSGIDKLGLSSPRSAEKLNLRSRARCELICLTLPQQSLEVVRHAEASLHITETTMTAFADALEAVQMTHAIWIGILTSDDREGLLVGDLHDRMEDWHRRLGSRLALKGLLGHWGCRLNSPPPAKEIESIFESAARLGLRLRGRPLEVSLGGSVLLPILDQFVAPPETQLRIGEAILTGTIPGLDHHSLDLRPPFMMEARTVEVSTRWVNGALRPRILIDYGSAVLDHCDIRLLEGNGRALWSSSNMTAIELSECSPPPRLGQTMKFAIGYRSALRALSNHAIRRVQRSPGTEIFAEPAT